jgi:hypothetical protein
VVPLADSLYHRLQILYPFGIIIRSDGREPVPPISCVNFAPPFLRVLRLSVGSV